MLEGSSSKDRFKMSTETFVIQLAENALYDVYPSLFLIGPCYGTNPGSFMGSGFVPKHEPMRNSKARASGTLPQYGPIRNTEVWVYQSYGRMKIPTTVT